MDQVVSGEVRKAQEYVTFVSVRQLVNASLSTEIESYVLIMV